MDLFTKKKKHITISFSISESAFSAREIWKIRSETISTCFVEVFFKMTIFSEMISSLLKKWDAHKLINNPSLIQCNSRVAKLSCYLAMMDSSGCVDLVANEARVVINAWHRVRRRWCWGHHRSTTLADFSLSSLPALQHCSLFESNRKTEHNGDNSEVKIIYDQSTAAPTL